MKTEMNAKQQQEEEQLMTQGKNQDEDIVNSLKLKDQPTWQLALELSALKKKLAYIENELNVLGQDNIESSGKAQSERELILEKIHALEQEIEDRKRDAFGPYNNNKKN